MDIDLKHAIGVVLITMVVLMTFGIIAITV